MKACLTALEFYSGIGGMHCALERVCPGAEVLAAFDINPTANAVYQHNFDIPPKQVDLTTLTAAALDSYDASLWMLAPPCQPFTRQGKQLGSQDARSNSFLHLLQQLPAMQHQPQWLLVENVVGFQGTDVAARLAQVLADCGYHKQEYVLTPAQYGVPYSRPRYFCVASKQPLPVQLPAEVQPCQATPSLLLHLQQQQASTAALLEAARRPQASHVQEEVPTLAEFLAFDSLHACSQHQQEQQHQEWGKEQEQAQEQQQGQQQTQQSQGGQQKQGQEQQQQAPEGQQAGANAPWVWVRDAVLQKHADVIDVVAWQSRSCNCFTKAYGHFARGAGSLLATVPDLASVDPRWFLVDGAGSLNLHGFPSGSHHHQQHQGRQGERGCGGDAAVDGSSVAATRQELAAAWQQLRLRYFTPQEIAALHSFPASFSFPGDCSHRQAYKLLGNSLSVVVVADLLAYLLHTHLCWVH